MRVVFKGLNGEQRSRFIAFVMSLTFVAILLSVAPAPAQAATCSRRVCVGQDPDAAGCSSNRTLLTREFSIASIQIRASDTCKAVWARSVSGRHYNGMTAQVWTAWDKRDLDTDHMGDALRTGRAQVSLSQLTEGTNWGKMVFGRWIRLCGSTSFGKGAIPDWQDCQPLRSLTKNPYWIPPPGRVR